MIHSSFLDVDWWSILFWMVIHFSLVFEILHFLLKRVVERLLVVWCCPQIAPTQHFLLNPYSKNLQRKYRKKRTRKFLLLNAVNISIMRTSFENQPFLFKWFSLARGRVGGGWHVAKITTKSGWCVIPRSSQSGTAHHRTVFLPFSISTLCFRQSCKK